MVEKSELYESFKFHLMNNFNGHHNIIQPSANVAWLLELHLWRTSFNRLSRKFGNT